MAGLVFDIHSLQVFSALIMLTIASVWDIWKREIHDVLWIAFGAVAILFIERKWNAMSSTSVEPKLPERTAMTQIEEALTAAVATPRD